MPDDAKAGAKTPKEEKPAKEEPKTQAEKEYKPRAKPEVTAAEKAALDLRRDKSRRRPEFHRQQWFRYKRVGDQWRKPRGIHSKLRRHFSGENAMVAIGYRGPKAARGRHPSGFEEVLIHNIAEMEIRILNFDRATHEELVAEAKKRGIGLPVKEGKE